MFVWTRRPVIRADVLREMRLSLMSFYRGAAARPYSKPILFTAKKFIVAGSKAGVPRGA
ncbi:hypothetical protein EMEDMD4_910120 [Sinorhizobium medicae]|uniref:Uncharacterized protein n=1 Tax=Sinorhizobium medicae TaxID=110321 RepID=A0A508X7Z7_9HYPH|nr:hypothetical protein EMEDMD4_910120 [Sinorhizobium medicae]